MKIFFNTTSLDEFKNNFDFTEDKSNAELMVVGGRKIILENFPKLKVIYKMGVGTDNLPFKEAKKLNINIHMPSEKTKNLIYEETANTTIGLIFRMIYNNVGDIEKWKKSPRRILREKRLLIIGYGNIGKRVYNKLKNFLEVDIYDNILYPGNLDDLISKADVISLHVPLTIENVNFIGEEKLSLMKDGAILINTARGKLVDEDALYKYISKGKICAAFDVFWKEPYRGKLKEFHPDRFYMTPHIASNTINFLGSCVSDVKVIIEKYK
jgi:phosphoglycerate dehydrogenase-like enzyme